jgi:Endonuclease/Exonuclease/phosphatase family
MLTKKVYLEVTGTLVLTFLFLTFADSQEEHYTVNVRLMFYNVENLFDTYDDTLKNDDEFLPGGLMRWNQSRYNKKINSVYKTIVAAGEWEPPAIIGFCEIENRKVLEDLAYGTHLSHYGYGIIHNESPDSRGIDVCMIFRKGLVHIIDYGSWIPCTVNKDDFHSRSVLYVKCAIGEDTIHLLINHWPSRRGGVLAEEPLRNKIASMIRNAADSIYTTSAESKIIIMGDFNCTPDDPVIQSLVNHKVSGSNLNTLSLVNLAAKPKTGISGTYRYMGTWEILDQVIVSENLLKCKKGLFTDIRYFRIFQPDFLLRNDPKYPGRTTFSTYKGYRYQGGFSDHLPVLLDLGFR